MDKDRKDISGVPEENGDVKPKIPQPDDFFDEDDSPQELPETPPDTDESLPGDGEPEGEWEEYFEEGSEEGSQEPLLRRDARRRRRIPRRYRPMLIAALSFVILGTLYLGIRFFFPEPEPDNDTQTGTTYDYLVQYDQSEIDALHFKFGDGYEYRLKLTRQLADSGYVETKYTVLGKTEYEYDPTAFSSMMSAISKITSATFAVKAPEDLSVYGLENPLVRVTYEASDNRTSVILVGDPAPVGTGYYAMIEGGDQIYVIGSYNASYLIRKDMYYRNKVITNYTDVLTEIESVYIEKDGEPLMVGRTDEEERERIGMFVTDYRIRQPVTTGCNSVYFQEYILTPLTNITALEVIEDRPADLKKYGLDESDEMTVVEIKNTDGSSRRIYLGADAGDGAVYARINGITSVYTFEKALFDFTGTKYRDIMDFALWVFMISEVRSVEIYLDGEEHLLEFNHIDEENLEGKLDGEEIVQENARQLYTRILQIYSYDVFDPEAEVGEIVYSIKINFTDGTTQRLDMHRITDRAYSVYRNGEPTGVYTRINDLNKIINGIRDVKIGYVLKNVS